MLFAMMVQTNLCDATGLTPLGVASAGWPKDVLHALAAVQPYLEHYGYAAIFVAILAEGIGLLAPGQSLLVAAALMAAHGDLNIVWVWCCAFLASFLGPCVAFFLGRTGGPPLMAKIKVNPEHLDRFMKLFAAYGPGLILVARFVDGLRQLHGWAAGLANMPVRTFLSLSLLGAALWTSSWGLGAYFLDQHVAAWHLAWKSLRPWLLALTLCICLAAVLWLRHRTR